VNELEDKQSREQCRQQIETQHEPEQEGCNHPRCDEIWPARLVSFEGRGIAQRGLKGGIHSLQSRDASCR
jgi:hypothetical protein